MGVVEDGLDEEGETEEHGSEEEVAHEVLDGDVFGVGEVGELACDDNVVERKREEAENEELEDEGEVEVLLFAFVLHLDCVVFVHEQLQIYVLF